MLVGKEKDDILMINYQNLHQSIWEAHKTAWTVTNIFMVIVFTLEGYLIKEFEEFSKFQVFMGVIALIFLLYIWWQFMKMLHQYNTVRIYKLKEIEDEFNKTKGFSDVLFEQHNLNYDDEFLFKISSDFCKDLIEGIVSKNLAQEFLRQKIRLHDDANILVKKKDYKWEIRDRRAKFLIKRFSDGFGIYRKHNKVLGQNKSGKKILGKYSPMRIYRMIFITFIIINVLLLLYKLSLNL